MTRNIHFGRNRPVRYGITLGLTLLPLSGCATGPVGSPQQDGAGQPVAVSHVSTTVREQTADQQVLQVLNRLAFGPRPGDVAAVRTIGVDKWIEQQLHPDRVPDSSITAFLKNYTTLNQTGAELYSKFPPRAQLKKDNLKSNAPNSTADSIRLREIARLSNLMLDELISSRVARAVSSQRQLEEVMVDFWENHFTVFSGKDRVRYYLPEFDANVIRPHALGKFRDLLGAVAHSGAMLYYLDNWQSVADSGRPVLGTTKRPAQALRRRGLNENYARELMELHTLGVDGGYTQQDVIEVARALTGWTLSAGAQGGEFVFRPQVHDAGAKVILGHKFPAGRGVQEGEAVLDLLARHPATARFIATKLARRFVSDTPPAALIERATNSFLSTDGDIRAVVRTIVTSPEFFSSSAFRAKVKSPFELVVSTMRAMNAPPDPTPRTARLVAQLGQPIFGHRAPNGYPETGDAWMNTGAILNRINFGLTVANGRVPGVKLADWTPFASIQQLPEGQQVDAVIRELLGGIASTDTRQVLESGINPLLETRDATSDTSNRNATMRGQQPRTQPRKQQAAGLTQIVGLALGSPEFQRR